MYRISEDYTSIYIVYNISLKENKTNWLIKQLIKSMKPQAYFLSTKLNVGSVVKGVSSCDVTDWEKGWGWHTCTSWWHISTLSVANLHIHIQSARLARASRWVDCQSVQMKTDLKLNQKKINYYIAILYPTNHFHQATVEYPNIQNKTE